MRASARAKQTRRCVGLVGLLLLLAAPAAAQEDEFCARLAAAVADAPNKFKSLRGERFDNVLESFDASLQLPTLEACLVDAIDPGYFCMTRGMDEDAADELMGELVQRVHACYPHVRARRAQDPRSPVARLVTEWTFADGRQIRVVRRTYREHPGSVFLHVR